MNFYILTLFPDMVSQGLSTSIIGRAMEKNLIHIETINIRDYTIDKHKKVDDYPYGGGAGMVMQAQPVYDAWESVVTRIGYMPRTVYLTPQGPTFRQCMAKDYAKEKDLILLCGHYEGIDERVLEEIVTDYVSIGDYVLTGGELPAMVLVDAISRMVPGVLSNSESKTTESFEDNLLEYPQYSRPEVWKGKSVPAVLLSGDHAKVDAWRREQSILRTAQRRPDLLRNRETPENAV
ncbi:MAG: tRNA (guanosine(37)-N1)-methyltransferase TrmD [Roseburia sp.]